MIFGACRVQKVIKFLGKTHQDFPALYVFLDFLDLMSAKPYKSLHETHGGLLEQTSGTTTYISFLRQNP